MNTEQTSKNIFMYILVIYKAKRMCICKVYIDIFLSKTF